MSLSLEYILLQEAVLQYRKVIGNLPDTKRNLKSANDVNSIKREISVPISQANAGVTIQSSGIFNQDSDATNGMR